MSEYNKISKLSGNIAKILDSKITITNYFLYSEFKRNHVIDIRTLYYLPIFKDIRERR